MVGRFEGVQVEAQIRRKLDKAFQRFGSETPLWVLQLDDVDETPIYYRERDVAFLSEYQRSDRGMLLIEYAIEKLNQILDVLASHAEKRTCFACVTIQGWEDVRSGDCMTITPHLFIDPNVSDELINSDTRLSIGTSPEAMETIEWLRRLGLEGEFIVADDPIGTDPEIQRVYVGPMKERSTCVLGLEVFLDHNV